MGEHIKATFRAENTTKIRPNTLNEFGKWIESLGIPPINTNVHFANYYSLCAPCLVQYDLIMKQETLITDAQDFFKDVLHSKLGTKALLDPAIGPHDESHSKTLVQYYAELEPHVQHSIRKFIEPDAILFGY